MSMYEENVDFKELSVIVANVIEENNEWLFDDLIGEPNDESTRRIVRSKVMSIVDSVAPNLAVKCDEGNNTPGIIANFELVFDVFHIIENVNLVRVVVGPEGIKLKRSKLCQ